MNGINVHGLSEIDLGINTVVINNLCDITEVIHTCAQQLFIICGE